MSSYPYIKSGQQAGTGTAAALPDLAGPSGQGWRVTLSALKANSGGVYIGPAGVTTSTGCEISAGTSITLLVNNLNEIYIVGNSNTISWVATPA